MEQNISVEDCQPGWVVLALTLGLGISKVVEKGGTVVRSGNERKPHIELKKGGLKGGNLWTGL